MVLQGAVGGKERNVALAPQQFKAEIRMAADDFRFFFGQFAFFPPEPIRKLGHADVKQQRADAKVEQLLGAVAFGDADDTGDRGDVD